MKKIYVMSGKGGVGKTTIAANIARYLSKESKVGLLDADIHGPNADLMLGVKGNLMYGEDNKIMPFTVNNNLSMVSVGFITGREDAVLWRGPLKHNTIKQFIEDVSWPELEWMIVDLPPGTGDECMSAVQLLGKDDAFAVIVSTPQKVSIADSLRAIDFCNQMELKIGGMIENMSGTIFGSGEIEKICKEKSIEFLGQIEMSADIAKSNEEGIAIDESKINPIIKKIVARFS